MATAEMEQFEKEAAEAGYPDAIRSPFGNGDGYLYQRDADRFAGWSIARAKNACEWKPDDDGTFWTGCDQAFVFNEGGPKDNDMKFCPYCGAELVTPNVEVSSGAQESAKSDAGSPSAAPQG